MKMAIGIPTLGRPEILKGAIDRFSLQSRIPDKIFISPVSDSDVSKITFDGRTLVRVPSDKGLTKQRNAILEAAKDYDIIVYFDDDFVIHKDCLKKIEEEFLNNPRTVIAHGTVIVDGAKIGGISFEDACNFTDNATLDPDARKHSFSTYGFMAIRMKTAQNNNIKFDEKLIYYSWLEDLDFSRQIVKYGDCVHINNAIGAHLAHSGGRTSGVRFGYSQVANPLYIAAKKTGFSYSKACKMFTKNFIANLIKSIRPEPYIDRRGRLKGNLIAFKDILLGKLDPQRIESL